MGETLATSGGSQVQTWLAAVGFVLFSMVIAATMLGAAKLFAVKSKKPGALRDRPYECGEEPVGETRIQFHPRYYVVALFFVLFDVEAAFLFPWALVLSKLGVAALVLMGIFMAVLMLGWLYALKKEALRWQ
ncbi:MAG: NADH-quinone oxidoreductase subunit A [Deltaproteobacteria bacterium]|nr:NADH-quinone oxidoreductase subunit A [Deltaproteobacteria bacterium]